MTKDGADAGIAHDGDADRCLAVDATGEVIDGDQILAVLALGLKASGRLAGDTVVATVMSNLGFRYAMRDAGITVVETTVGDRYVLEAMRAGQFVLGGEQSGHIIMLDHATTGDGLLTALHLLAAVARQRTPLADLARVMTRYPQVLVNVAGVDKARVAASPGTGRRGRRGRGGARHCGPRPGPAERHRASRAGHGRGYRARARPAARRRPGRDDPLAVLGRSGRRGPRAGERRRPAPR